MFSLLFSEGCGFLRLWSVKHADSLATIGPIPQCEGIPFAQWVLVQMGWERVEKVEKVENGREGTFFTEGPSHPEASGLGV